VGARAPALYISGTASIRDSESMHVGDVGAQTRLAIENLDIVADAAQMDTSWRAGGRVLRAYVRHSEHAEVVCHLVEKHLLRFGDMFNVIQADICRTDLLVELEAFVPAG
jgi:enamine deaminase RidA (YjgF/YER057c/UK114 family)